MNIRTCIIIFIGCSSIMSCNTDKKNERDISIEDNLSVIEKEDNRKDTIDIESETLVNLKIEKSNLVKALESQGLVRVDSLDPTIQIELKYATNDNFTKGILYDSLTQAYLHPIAAEKLVRAQKLLQEKDSTLSLLVYDAVRPLSIQRKMYKVVQNTPYHRYVANPEKTGLHNYGIAVDLTICDQAGKHLDMGTPFDFFGSAAGINKEEELIRAGKLTRLQVDNRKLLREVMTKAGFLTIRGEWWHFNAISLAEAKKTIKVIE